MKISSENIMQIVKTTGFDMENEYRYENQPENSYCKDCRIAIWVRQGVYTIHHGKGNYWNNPRIKEPCSYHTLEGAVCVDCFNTEYEKKDN